MNIFFVSLLVTIAIFIVWYTICIVMDARVKSRKQAQEALSKALDEARRKADEEGYLRGVKATHRQIAGWIFPNEHSSLVGEKTSREIGAEIYSLHQQVAETREELARLTARKKRQPKAPQSKA